MNYLTGLGQALAVQNERTIKALAEAGHRITTVKAGTKIERYPFSTDPKEQKQFAAMGEALLGGDAKPPIIWPDMAKVAEQARAARPPMSEETKEKLRAHNEANPRDIGDEVAIKLRNCKTLDDVYKAAAEYLGVPEQELRDKYAKLNAGQQRMNCGNRMRAKWRKDNLNAGTRKPQSEIAK